MTAVTPYDAHAPMLPNGGSAIWRALPLWAGVPIWVGSALFLVGPLLVYGFFAGFPEPVGRTRVTRWLVWLPPLALALVADPVLALAMCRFVYHPERWPGTMPDWFTPFVGAAVLSMVGLGLVLLAVNYRRLASRTGGAGSAC